MFIHYNKIIDRKIDRLKHLVYEIYKKKLNT